MNDLVLAVLPLLVNLCLEVSIDVGLRLLIDEEVTVLGAISSRELSNIPSILEVRKAESLFQVEHLLAFTEY